MMSTDSNRNNGLDLLRIVSMIFVIGLHYFYNCSIDKLQSFGFNFALNWLLEAVCYTSVDIFILITGYFGIESRKQNLKRVLGLVTGVWFYSWLGLVIYLLIHKKAPLLFVNTSLFPIVNGHYWFISAYVILILLQPVLNILMQRLDEGCCSMRKDVHGKHFSMSMKITVLLVVLFCVIPTIFPKADPNFKLSGGTHILWFITLYYIGGMIRKHEDDLKNKKIIILTLVFSILIPFTVKVGIMGIMGISKGGAVFYHHNSIFILSAAVCLFLLFKDIEIRSNRTQKIIYSVSQATFGVYLIHENLAVKEYLWDIVRKLQDLNSVTWGGMAIATILLIFIICTGIETIRLVLFRTSKVNDKFYRFVYTFFEKIRKRVARWENTK